MEIYGSDFETRGKDDKSPVTDADELAEAILAIAREHDVPIYENAELVKLLARLELGDAIPEALYRTIAEIIAFAWYLKGKCPPGFSTHKDPSTLPLLNGPER